MHLALDASVQSLVQKGILAALCLTVVNPPTPQEDLMKKLISSIVFTFTLTILFSVPALAQNNHSVWSDSQPIACRDGATGASYNAFLDGDASFAWTQGTVRSYAHALARINAALNYDFMLISVTSATASEIRGRWIIRRNGAVVCNNCIGRAYILNAPVGDYFKIYVGTPMVYAERWHYSGKITSRFDY